MTTNESPYFLRAVIFGLLVCAIGSTAAYIGLNYELGPTPWHAEYFSGTSFSGAPLLERTEKRVMYDWKQGSPAPVVPADGFSARWRSCFSLETSAEVYFMLSSDDGAKLRVNSTVVLDRPTYSAESVSSPLRLEPGSHLIELEYFEQGGLAGVSLQGYIAGHSRPLLEPKRLSSARRGPDGIWDCP